MPQFDVYPNRDGAGYLIDCQADALADYSTRLVVPLQPPEIAPKQAGRLNPTFLIGNEHFVMVTQFAAAIPVRELGPVVTSLGAHRYDVTGALDVLLTGV